ncbi:MAG: hypothetical protein EOP05_07645 [Proteobacteria bacterium]|nr:MAG: hypothetical protein EOP05_07645 [Pseudomonadota bacterium]
MSHALFTFVVSIFGFAFAIRISDHFIERNLFDRSAMTKIGTAYLACVIALSSFLPHSRTSLWLALFTPLLIFAFSLSSSVSRRSLNFKRDVLSALSVVILKMKSGRSFRQSLLETTSECSPHLRAKLTEIINVVAFSQQNKLVSRDVFVRELVDEFMLIDQQPHASMRRLNVLRDKLRIEEDFRRRSGQVLSRLRAQSLVMCGLYLAVFMFMIWKFGWQRNVQALTISMLLFSIGVMWMWIGGRRLKWKV